MWARFTVAAVVCVWALATAATAQRSDSFGASRDHKAIAYSTTPGSNAITMLNERVQQDRLTLRYEPARGYLESVLAALSIPVESQVLAYAQTSQQANHISRDNPRAIYFRDDVAVAWIRGADLLEVAVQDRAQGTLFYTLRQVEAERPVFTRNDNCLACHLSWDTRAVPGPFVQTVFPRRSDEEYANGFVVDHRAPLVERWGGWFVTGERVPRSMANQPLLQPKLPETGALATDIKTVTLEGVFDGRGYMTMFSDVVALMLLDHQAHATNLITRAGWEHRVGSAHVRAAVDELVDYLLFVDEAPLPHPIKGSSGFAEKFASQGPVDSKGRSLRELDLQTRMMRYPLSYMIYSPGFAGLPAQVKSMVRERLDHILSGADRHGKYKHLDAPTRVAITEILRETLSGASGG